MDIENRPEETGFPALARKLAINPDYEGFVFRTFDRLSARNLLHMEAKLACLEWKLDQVDERVAHGDNEGLRSIRAWEAFEESAKHDARPEYLQMKMCEEIKEALKEYQEALLRQHQVASLGEPETRVLKALRNQSHSTQGDPLLAGLAANRLDDSNRWDLVAIRRPVDKDMLFVFLQNHWMFRTTKIPNDTEYYKENHVAWAGAVISTGAAAGLLLGAIVALRVLEDRDVQLGLIGIFMALFAISVAVLTNARRAEVSASTVAYAAFLVVFVSSSPWSSGVGKDCAR
ncbi:uncharacterized protein B0T15DRAFT_534397 [Chaetomium strumarium]|uniref:DUF6594 domain-containing protein n=1 Tax=Chaetomium strumarium TaxID=1170767 RepID=A0AAJ0GTW6_9PEZI|nr:hypothetical protein B0T15DRAFT_534397 [Chaetomium strumarium]